MRNNPKKNPIIVYILALCLLVGGVGYLIISGFSSSSMYFLNVSEVLAMKKKPEIGKQFRLFGNVAEKNLLLASNRLAVDFDLIDKDQHDKIIRVDYSGVIPDTFKPGVEVIVEGTLHEGKFVAKSIVTKCPSKYEKGGKGRA